MQKTLHRLRCLRSLARAERITRSLVFGVAFSGAVTSIAPSSATAETLQVSAVAFVLRTADGSSDLVGEENMGVFTAGTGRYFAAIVFPVDGQRVCRFGLVARDNDADFNIEARLMKKAVTVGGNPFTPPVTMAKVQTSGASATVVRRTTGSIVQPIISTTTAFYYALLTTPVQTLEVLGVQVEYKPTCS